LIDFTDFRVLTPSLHVLWVLTRKIVQFYELKRIFNNHVGVLLNNQIGVYIDFELKIIKKNQNLNFDFEDN